MTPDYAFTKPLTPEEASCLLAHLPTKNSYEGLHRKNPVLYLALRKLDWQARENDREER